VVVIAAVVVETTIAAGAVVVAVVVETTIAAGAVIVKG
jgi:hypothetical protein